MRTGQWSGEATGERLRTFSVVTTKANEHLTEIHNSKHRMPIILPRAMEKEWLGKRDIQDFAFPTHEVELKAINLDEPLYPTSLF